MLNYHSQKYIAKQTHKNNFTADDDNKTNKTNSIEKQQNSTVKLGEYLRQREYSRQKEIEGQITSSQLVGDEDPIKKQIKFKKDNVIILYDKISAEITKKRSHLNQKNYEELCKEQQYLQELLKMIVGTKPGDLYAKVPRSTQTTDISISPNASIKFSKQKTNTQQLRFRTEIDIFNPKYKISQNILGQLKLKDDKKEQYSNKYGNSYQIRYESSQKGGSKKSPNISALSEQNSKQSSVTSNMKMRRPPIVPKK